MVTHQRRPVRYHTSASIRPPKMSQRILPMVFYFMSARKSIIIPIERFQSGAKKMRQE